MQLRAGGGPPLASADLVEAPQPGGGLAVTVFLAVAGVLVAIGTVVLAIYARPVDLTEEQLILEDC